jgi:hypothetical protein
MLIYHVDSDDWAHAIAVRIADEWRSDFAEDKDTLRQALEASLKSSPESIKFMIGTGIIEKSYFEPLD